MFKNSKWIWKSNRVSINSYGTFIKNVHLEKGFLSADLSISAHNHMKCFINKQLVSGLVTPAPSNINEDKLCLSYEIKDYLKAGNNLIEVVVLYLGGSGQNYKNGQPGFILESKITYKDEVVNVVSDESWQHLVNHPYVDDMPYQQKRRITPVEFYDSTKLLEEPLYSNVFCLEGYTSYKEQEIPEGAIFETITPKLVNKEPNVFVYDCLRILSGFPLIKVKSNTQATITIRYSEDLESGRVKHNVANEFSSTYYDKIKVGQSQNITHQFDFTYKAFRYVEVTWAKDELIDFELLIQVASTNIQISGDLKSRTHPYITKLFTMFKHTQRNNVLGLLVDCPHREQAQYLGDSALQLESIIYNVKERTELIEKVLKDFKSAQYKDGSFPFVSPGSTEYEEFSLKIPEYDLYFIELILKRYQINQNESFLIEYFEPAKKIIDLYCYKIDETGLVKKNNDWHISDWPYPNVDHDGKYLTYENMLFYRQLETFINLYPSYAIENNYQQILNSLKVAIVSLLKSNKLYKDNLTSDSYHQGIQAVALEYGFFEPNEVDLVLDYIVAKAFDSSIILSRNVLTVLFKYGKTKEAFDYMFKYDKGWGAILRKEQPTMWEGFNDIESHSHAWGMYVVRLIQTYVVGIQIANNDPKVVKVTPQHIKEIKDIKATIITEQGLLTFGYEVFENHIEYIYDLPMYTNVNLIINDKEIPLTGMGSLIISVK